MGWINKGTWNNAGRTIVKGFRSLSDWEDSFYGGYERVLWDYPTIKVDWNIEWEKGDKVTMEHFLHSKLMKLFLLRVNEKKLIPYLTDNIQKKRVKLYGSEVTRYSFSKKSVNNVINMIIGAGGELKNMFDHYQGEISNTHFYYDEPDKNDNKGEGKEGGGDGSGEDTPGKTTTEVVKGIQKLLAETKKDEWTNKSWNSWGNITSGTSAFCVMPRVGLCDYSREEMLYANQLLNMLDISFDPHHDRVNNLVSGKLDNRKICEVLGGNTNIHYRVEENQTTRPFSICMLADESGSMSGDRMSMQYSVFKVLYKVFSQLMPPEKIFVYGHTTNGGGAHIRVYNDRYNHIFEESIDNMFTNDNDGTPCSITIDAVHRKVRSFTNDNIIFIYICDGHPNGGSAAIPVLKKIVERCKRDGFVTCGVGIMSKHVKDIYNYSTVVDELDQMVKKVSMLVNHVVKTEFQS